MSGAKEFKVSASWKLLLTDMGIDTEAVLAHARLPADLFARDKASLTAMEYFQLWHGIEAASGDRELPLLLAENFSVEAFDAPIFASLCSADLNSAVLRMQRYKPLIGPMEITVAIDEQGTSVSMSCYGYPESMPNTLELSEMVFFTCLCRLATREPVNPVSVVLSEIPKNRGAYEDFFGCPIKCGKGPEVRFRAEDARRPFLTANAAMWNYFEAGLNKNLANIKEKSSMVERVRAALIELLPAGKSSIEAVAEKLAISKRTLQRKLTNESESYQSVLQTVRTELANHYLSRSKMSVGEISFLLGYQEPNSFVRAYKSWAGVAPGSAREAQ